MTRRTGRVARAAKPPAGWIHPDVARRARVEILASRLTRAPLIDWSAALFFLQFECAAEQREVASALGRWMMLRQCVRQNLLDVLRARAASVGG